MTDQKKIEKIRRILRKYQKELKDALRFKGSGFRMMSASQEAMKKITKVVS